MKPLILLAAIFLLGSCAASRYRMLHAEVLKESELDLYVCGQVPGETAYQCVPYEDLAKKLQDGPTRL